MNATQQRIKIAEACGWTAISIYPDGTAMAFDSSKILRAKLPDYLNDLNACHEMEKVLTDTHANDQWSPYCVKLNHLACGCGNLTTCGYTIAATAAQRAEAFLRTLNLWQETPTAREGEKK